jgi:prepilin-type N-terminal cleavage/methylation domain-containing protein
MGADAETRQRGLSLIEAMITLAILLVAMTAFYQMMIGASRAGMFSESRNDLVVISERVVNAIQEEARQSKLVFEENSVGTGYRTLFVSGLPAGMSVWANSRLPLIDAATTTLGPDPGPNGIAQRTGNMLILARQLAPVPVPYDHDANAGTADVSFLVDRYEFQLYFLRANSARNFGNFGYYLDLVRAKSEVFADYVQLSNVGTNQAQLIQRVLAATPIRTAWDPGKAVNAPAFYTLAGSGSLTAASPSRFTVSTTSLCPEFAGGRIAGAMEYSVSLNSNTPMATRDVVPLYATASGSFPGGFEVQVVGGSGSRKILTRLVLAAWYGNQFNSQQASVITASHGF